MENGLTQLLPKIPIGWIADQKAYQSADQGGKRKKCKARKRCQDGKKMISIKMRRSHRSLDGWQKRINNSSHLARGEFSWKPNKAQESISPKDQSWRSDTLFHFLPQQKRPSKTQCPSDLSSLRWTCRLKTRRQWRSPTRGSLHQERSFIISNLPSSGDEHRTGSTVAEPDTWVGLCTLCPQSTANNIRSEIYQDLDRAENDAITPVSGADLAQDLSGMGALFSDEVLKNVHPILKIEWVLDG